MKTLLLLVFFHFFSFLFGQEQPPISTYTPQQYHAENQNWDISQSDNKYIYIANNLGLLEFNGAKWQLYNSPNETIMRSVEVVGNKIYTGCYMEFGFWEKNSFGKLEYTSLSKTLKIPLVEDEQIWQILNINNWILFRSLNRIYLYDSLNKTLKIINSKTRITGMFQIDDTIYYQAINSGIYKLINGQSVLLTNHIDIVNKNVVKIFKAQGGLLFLTQENGFFTYNNSLLKPWNNKINLNLENYSVYSSIKLKNGNYAIGTISNGVIFIDENGNFIEKVAQENGLTNNTVLSLFEDIDSNIWLALDNGICNIDIDSPIRIFNDVKGKLGTVYASSIFNNKLYLGTNQGLFYKPLNANESFKLISGTKGQVWCLNLINNELFCGHNLGTFIVKENTVEKISNVQGTWSIKPLGNNQNKIIQGNYNGLNILEKINNKWSFKNKIEGFDISSRFFEFINPNQILVSHEYKGIFNLTINNNYNKVSQITKDTTLKGIHSSLFKYNKKIYYAYNNGVFKYNSASKNFEKDSLLSKTYNSKSYVSGKLIVDDSTGKLWSFSKNNINVITSGTLSSTPSIKKIQISNSLRKGVPSYENVLKLNDSKYLFGSSSGYLTIDLTNVKKETYNISINSIEVNTLENKISKLKIEEKEILKNFENNLSFEYSVPKFNKFQNVEYQYQLVGLYNMWSDWSLNSKTQYKNLPPGEYIFNVRAKIGENLTKNISSYTFEIEKPWYLSSVFIAIYIIIGLLLILLTHKLYNRYYKRERERLLKKTTRELERKELENAQQIMQFQNEKLQKDIETKNKELASSTMSLIKKNEFLNNLKKELNAVALGDNIAPVIKIIDKNINNTDDWKLFQEAFNNADKGFMKKVKSKHPNLTPNDLKLCAYLRLNLSSKEIAPLLNISPRSVEVKRYRLRKKMELPRETSLTNYIIEL
ncbi:MAG: LuxR family transcriptional regulator [Lacinutrix sp. MedPE-SW]|nr:MAG: LuxR family transcriptional regulator [Lacinutrix sp. MedPE-SW]